MDLTLLKWYLARRDVAIASSREFVPCGRFTGFEDFATCSLNIASRGRCPVCSRAEKSIPFKTSQ